MKSTPRCYVAMLFTVCLLYAAPAKASATEPSTPASQWEAERQKAADAFATLDKNNSYTDQLSMGDLNRLPMGISRHLSNVEYTIAVSAMRLMPGYAELTVYGRVKVPQSADGQTRNDKILFFGAQGVQPIRSAGHIRTTAAL